MKILHTVETYTPLVSGMQEVVKQLSERLVKQGHSVTVATSKIGNRYSNNINGVNIVEFNIKGNFTGTLIGEVSNYREFLLESNFDIVTNFAAQIWTTDVMLPILNQVHGKKVFVPTGFSGLYQAEFKTYFEQMKYWLKQYDKNVFLSNNYRDINFARENKVDNIALIPNGADENEFLNESDRSIRNKYSIPRDAFLIMTIGSHTNLKGHKESLQIFEKANIQNATLFINGNEVNRGCKDSCKDFADRFNNSSQRRFDRKHIIVDFPERADTVNLLKEADLFLFPSNIECSPIVLFEAAASKTPFLVTDVGNSVEICNWTNGGLVLPTYKDAKGNSFAKIDESVKMLENLYHNPSLRQELSDNGFKAWKEKFTWAGIAQQYEDLYLELVSKNSQQPNTQKLVTAITIVSNVAEFQKAFSTICKQSYLNLEKVVIDISSDSKIEDTIKDKKDIIYLKFPPQELPCLRNQGIKKSSGDYVVFLDPNNTWSSNHIESAVDIFDNSDLQNIGLVYANFKSVLANRKIDQNHSLMDFDLDVRGKVFDKIILQDKFKSNISGVLISGKDLKKVGDFDEALDKGYDWDMILRIAKNFEIDYFYEHSYLQNNQAYLSTIMDSSDIIFSHFQFINKWVGILPTNHKALKQWSNYLSWNSIIDYSLIYKVESGISNKRKLFAKTKGSFKLLLMFSLIAKIKLHLINLIRAIKDFILISVKSISFTIKNII